MIDFDVDFYSSGEAEFPADPSSNLFRDLPVELVSRNLTPFDSSSNLNTFTLPANLLVPAEPLTPQATTGRLSGLLNLKSLFQADRASCSSLLEAYHASLEKSFPCPGEVAKLEWFETPLQSLDSWYAFGAVVDSKLVGGINGSIIEACGQRWGVIEQIFVDEEMRRSEHRLGKRLYGQFLGLAESVGARGVLAEVRDPLLLSEKRIERIGETPQETILRREWWSRQGHSTVDAFYMQAPLEPRGKRIADVMLTLKPLGDPIDHLSRTEYLKIVEAYFATFSEHGPTDDNRTLRIIEKRLGNHDEIPVIRMDQPRQCLKEMPYIRNHYR